MIVDLDTSDPAIDRVVNLIVRCAEMDAAAVEAARQNDLAKFQAACREARDGLAALELAARMAVAALGSRLVDQIDAEIAARGPAPKSGLDKAAKS